MGQHIFIGKLTVAALGAVILAASAAPVRAEDHGAAQGKPMTLLEIFTAANSGSPAIAAAQAGSDAASAGVRDAYFGLLPRASLIFDKQREMQNVIRTENPVYQAGRGYFGNSERTAQVVQPIFDAQIFAQLDIAYAGSDRAHFEQLMARQKVAYGTIEAYILTLGAIEDYRLSVAEEATLEGHQHDVTERIHRGLATQSDLDDVDGRLEQLRANVIAARANVHKAFAALRRMSGIDVTQVFPLRMTVPMVKPEPPDPEAWVKAAHVDNPEIKALTERAHELEGEYYKAIGEDLPRVELVASDDKLDAGGSLYGGGALTDERILELRLTIPLFNAEGHGYPAFQASAKAREARYDRDDRELDVAEKTRQAYLEAVSNAARSNALALAAQHRKHFVDDVNKRFRAGLVTTEVLLDAERDSYRAQRELLSSRYNYLLNMMQLKQLTGAISQEDVIYVNSLLDAQAPPVGKVDPD